jgi:peptidoglycan/LPS O-acetylase OafA/YrhL
MKRGISLYLDLLRFLAALVVLFQHLSWEHFSGGVFWQIGPYGAQAVIVFFVLSGYVIGYVTDRPDRTARRYAVDRLARIYSVALPAVLLTFALDAAGSWLRPDLYAGLWVNVDGAIWRQFLRNLLFLNQLWGADYYPGSNVPYWSMGYEVWYYVAFGLFLFLPRRWSVPAAIAVLVFVGPRVAGLFCVWLLGLAAYRLSRDRWPLSPAWGKALFFGAPVLLLAYELSTVRPLAPIPWQTGWELAKTATVGAFIAAHLLGAARIAPMLGRWLERWALPIRFMAGRSFSLYLFQLPVLQFLLSLMPWPPTSWFSRITLAVGTLAIVLLLAEVTERRKDVWRRLFDRLLPTSRPASSGAGTTPGPA